MYTRHPRRLAGLRSAVRLFDEMRLCRPLAPDITYTMPATYSWRSGLASSNARYSSTLIGDGTKCVSRICRVYARRDGSRKPPGSPHADKAFPGLGSSGCSIQVRDLDWIPVANVVWTRSGIGESARYAVTSRFVLPLQPAWPLRQIALDDELPASRLLRLPVRSLPRRPVRLRAGGRHPPRRVLFDHELPDLRPRQRPLDRPSRAADGLRPRARPRRRDLDSRR